MGKTKYYFESSSDEICYSESYFLEMMVENKTSAIELYEAIPEKIEGIGYCLKYCEVMEQSENPCGKHCDHYNPRNGKSGICRSWTNTVYSHGEKIVLKTILENEKD